MPRRKPYHFKSPTHDGLTAAQICELEKFDPFVELIRACKAKRCVRNKKGEPILDENGKPIWEPLLEPRLFVEATKALAEFVRPKLRCAEVKETLDATFNIVVKTFEKKSPSVQIESRQVLGVADAEVVKENGSSTAA